MCVGNIFEVLIARFAAKPTGMALVEGNIDKRDSRHQGMSTSVLDVINGILKGLNFFNINQIFG